MINTGTIRTSKTNLLGSILANRTVNETIEIIGRRLNVKLAVDTIKHQGLKTGWSC